MAVASDFKKFFIFLNEKNMDIILENHTRNNFLKIGIRI